MDASLSIFFYFAALLSYMLCHILFCIASSVLIDKLLFCHVLFFFTHFRFSRNMLRAEMP